jgi:hypothetical protein
VRFTSARQVAVPLDALPRWLLARSISTLQIAVAEPTDCPEFSLEEVRLWQRQLAALSTSIEKVRHANRTSGYVHQRSHADSPRASVWRLVVGNRLRAGR